MSKHILFILRLCLGWIFLYAGITKIINPLWSAAGYIHSAQTFTAFFAWLTTPAVLPVINILNAWGLTLLGLSLILGIATRYSAWAGILLLFLYYCVILHFPFVGTTGFLVDEHIIYILLLAFFATHEKSCGPTLEAWLVRRFVKH